MKKKIKDCTLLEIVKYCRKNKLCNDCIFKEFKLGLDVLYCNFFYAVDEKFLNKEIEVEDEETPVTWDGLIKEDKMKIELLKYPNEQDWKWVKTCTLNTIGKVSTTLPTEEWKQKIIESEHSPIRELWFGVRMTIPYWVSVHFVRHHIGINHYVQTQRTDRTGIDRNELRQGEMVSHIMSVNAQELVFMAHKRLCKQASPETREVMKMIVDEVIKVCPQMKSVLVPLCKYRNGKCTEFFPCSDLNNIK